MCVRSCAAGLDLAGWPTSSAAARPAGLRGHRRRAPGNGLRDPLGAAVRSHPPGWWGPVIDRDLHTVLWHGQDGAAGDPHGDTVDPALAAITTGEVHAAIDRALATDLTGQRRGG